MSGERPALPKDTVVAQPLPEQANTELEKPTQPKAKSVRRRLRGHQGDVLCLAVENRGVQAKQLASASEGGTLC